MAEIIKMPRLSDTMTDGVVAKWHKKIGDIYLKLNDINKAKDKYNFVVREYPNNTASSLALQLLKNME